MTAYQVIKARLIGQEFKPEEAKAIIAIAQAVPYARQFRRMWDAELRHFTDADIHKLTEQTDAIGRAYRLTFIPQPEPTLASHD